MSDWLPHLLWNALEASILAAALALVLTRVRVAAATRCALWLLVFVKLLVPPGLTHSLALSGLLRDASAVASQWILPVARPSAETESAPPRTTGEASNREATAAVPSDRTNTETPATASPSASATPEIAPVPPVRHHPVRAASRRPALPTRNHESREASGEILREAGSPRTTFVEHGARPRTSVEPTRPHRPEPVASAQASSLVTPSREGHDATTEIDPAAETDSFTLTTASSPPLTLSPSPPPTLPETGFAEAARSSLAPETDFAMTSLLVPFWALGAAAFLVLQITRLIRFGLRVRSLPPAPATVQSLSNALAARLGLRRSPPVRVLPRDASPLVWACGPPVVLIPPRLAAAQGTPHLLEAVLAHELAHLKRRDHWAAWLELLSGAVYYWLPTYWWSRRRIRDAADDAADALATRLLASREAYAEGLLGTLQLLNSPLHPLPPLARGIGGGTGVKDHLSRRLTMILREPLAPRTAWHVRLVLCFAALFVLPVGAATDAHSRSDSKDDSSTESSDRDDTGGATDPSGREDLDDFPFDSQVADDTADSSPPEDLGDLTFDGDPVTEFTDSRSSGSDEANALPDLGDPSGVDANPVAEDGSSLDDARPEPEDDRSGDFASRPDAVERRLANLERAVERILGLLERQASGDLTPVPLSNRASRRRPAQAAQDPFDDLALEPLPAPDELEPALDPTGVSGDLDLDSELDPAGVSGDLDLDSELALAGTPSEFDLETEDLDPSANAGGLDPFELPAGGNGRSRSSRGAAPPPAADLFDSPDAEAVPAGSDEIRLLQKRIAELEARNRLLEQRLIQVLERTSRAPGESRSMTEAGLDSVLAGSKSPAHDEVPWSTLRKGGAAGIDPAFRIAARAFSAKGLECNLLSVRSRGEEWTARIHLDAETWASVRKGFQNLLQAMPMARLENAKFAVSNDKSVVGFDLVLGSDDPPAGPPLTLGDLDRLTRALAAAGYGNFALQATSENLRTARPRVEVEVPLHDGDPASIASVLSSIARHYDAEMVLIQRDGEHEAKILLRPKPFADANAVEMNDF